MDTWAGRRIRAIFLLLSAAKFALVLVSFISPQWSKYEFTAGEIAGVIGWNLGWAAFMLGVPVLVVLGPFRRAPWLIWLVLVEAFLDVWGLAEWGQFVVRSPLWIVDAVLSLALLYYAIAWVRLPRA